MNRGSIQLNDRFYADVVEFDTSKDLDEIANILRSIDGEMERIIDDDPLGDLGDVIKEDIAVVIRGEHWRKGNLRKIRDGFWSMQVYITDLGDLRHVVLAALGESFFYPRIGERYYQMKYSKEKRDEIARLLA